MAHLYTAADGTHVNHHSYSAGAEFATCPRRYKLKRKDGWRIKAQKAYFQFGKDVEAAIQKYHDTGLLAGAGIENFVKRWELQKDVPLTYTDKEGDWAEMRRMGCDMLRLYEIFLPKLPIVTPKFQLKYTKSMFAHDSYLAGIDEVAYLDMYSQATSPETGQPDPIIIDIKTAAQAPSAIPGIVTLDQQMRNYAWLSGVRRVGMLFFVKAKFGDWKAGTSCTLLEDHTGRLRAGDELVYLCKKKKLNAILTDSPLGFIASANYGAYQKEAEPLSGKKLDALKEKYTEDYGQWIWPAVVSRVKLVFLEGRISEEVLAETGRVIAHEIAEIHSYEQKDYFPQRSGFRGMSAPCLMCDFLPICLGDEKAVAETLYQIKTPTSEETNWLDELAEE